MRKGDVRGRGVRGRVGWRPGRQRGLAAPVAGGPTGNRSPGPWPVSAGPRVRGSALAGFVAAIPSVNRLADLVKAANHHPDIEIHYRKITVRWWTHTAGGVTDRDRELAAKTNDLV